MVCIFSHNFIKLRCGYNGQRITGVLVGVVKFLHPTMQYEWVKKREKNWILLEKTSVKSHGESCIDESAQMLSNKV